MDTHPDQVARLLAIFRSLDSEFHPPSPKGSDEPGYCAAAANHAGFMVPWRTHPAAALSVAPAHAAERVEQDDVEAGDEDGGLADPLAWLDPESEAFATFAAGGGGGRL